MNSFLFLFLFLSSSCFGYVYEVSVCAIFHNEAPFLKEWLDFHKVQGVEHFYLYNHNSTDQFQSILEPYIEKNEVTLTNWSYTYGEGNHDEWIAIQTGAYMDCMTRFGKESLWMACIDLDEFLFCPGGESLPRFLKEYREFAGVGVNWWMFGTSHIEEIPTDAFLIEHLTHCSRKHYWENRFYKSIVQPRYVVGCKCAHSFKYEEGKYAVNSRKERIKNAYRSPGILLKHIRINHYCTRTEKYLKEVKIPLRIKRRPEYTPSMIQTLANCYNEKTDSAILQFLPKLKTRLAPKF